MSIDISDVMDVLSRLQLPIISEDYIERVIISHYAYYTLPETYETIILPDIDFPSIINESCELLNMYLQQPPSMHILWDHFVTDDGCCINPKTLSCLLNCFIQNAIKDVQEFTIRKNGLSAIRLFFLASTFTDSRKIGFFHMNILYKCSELISLCIDMLRCPGIIINSDIQLNKNEKNDLMADLLSIIRDIRVMVKRFHFFDEINSLDIIVDTMVDVTRLECNSGNILEQVPTALLSCGSLAFNAYSVLTDMFNDNCGTTLIIAQKLMFCLISGLLVDQQRDMHMSNKQFNVIRDHHLAFIRKLTRNLGVSFEYPLEILLQHLLHRGPDRSELKSRQFQIILEVWRLCSNNVRIKTKYYLFRLLHAVDGKLRIVALEVLFKLLSEPEEIEPDNPQLLPYMPTTKHEFIAALIVSRFTDPLLTVRAKAFSLFVTLTAGPPTSTINQSTLAKRVLVDPYLELESLNQTEFCISDFFDFYKFVDNMENFDPICISNSNIYPGVKTLLWILNVHARHERAYIRRLSLSLLCNLLLLNSKLLEPYYLSLLTISCSDSAITIRKVVISGLTDLLLKYPDNCDVLKYWFNGLIYLVGDRDKKIQELTVECMDRVILKHIKPYSAKLIDDNDPIDYLPWRVLNHAFKENVGLYMLGLCEKWQNQGFLVDNLIKNIMTYVNSSNHNWTFHSLYLLQLISQQTTIGGLAPIIKYVDKYWDIWFSVEDLYDQNNVLTCGQMIIDILFLNYKSLDKKTSKQLFDKIEKLLFNFKVPVRLISKSLDLFSVLFPGDPKERDTVLKNYFQTICKTIEISINVDNVLTKVQHIYTLGDIGLILYLKINKNLQQYLLNILCVANKKVSPAVKAISVLTIGKLSIVDDYLAKDAVYNFGEIIKDTSHSSMKINALIALADLCLCSTSLVEQVIPEMCICLKDNSLSVKQVALKLLIGLILEDYIKLRAVAFFALLCMLEDSNCHVRQETSSFIVNFLLVKNKNIMERKLVEVIYHFNGYTGCQLSGLRNCFNTSELKAYFSMEGNSKKASRHCVYRFMLMHMLDDSKIKLMMKMFSVFDQVINDVENVKRKDFTERAIQVMKDSFWILKSREMAVTSSKARDGNNDDDLASLEKVTDIAKKEVIISTYKTMMTDYIVPSVLQLVDDLEKNKNGLAVVMNDLRSYISLLISGKSPLKNEIVKLLNLQNEELVSEILLENKQVKQHKLSTKNDTGIDLENDEDHDRKIFFVEELQYVTWAQLMELHDRVEKPKEDTLKQSQTQKELEDNLSKVSISKNNIQGVAANITNQLIDKKAQLVKRKSRNIDSNGRFKRKKISENNDEVQLDRTHQVSNRKVSVDKTDDEDDDLPGYKLFK